MHFFPLPVTVLHRLDFCIAYIDDVPVASSSLDAHLKHQEIILQHFIDYGIIMNPIKYLFDQQEVNFLGDKISATGISPLLEKMKQSKKIFNSHYHDTNTAILRHGKFL